MFSSVKVYDKVEVDAYTQKTARELQAERKRREAYQAATQRVTVELRNYDDLTTKQRTEIDQLINGQILLGAGILC